jgi:hypothetical protein
VDVADGRWSVTHHRVPYDDTLLYDTFEAREVPERSFIYRAFFGGRLGAGA